MKYLDLKGLQYYTGKVQTEIDSAKGEVNSALQTHISNKSNPHNVTKDQVGLANVTNNAQVKRSEMGSANGVATLNESGTVPSSQLPSYVDDVLEYDNKSAFPPSGEAGKIYVAKDTNLTYRWSGSTYVEISQSLALGETSSTAYAGDKGAANRAAISSLPDSIISNIGLTNITGTTVGFNISRVNKSGLNYGSPTGSVLNIPAATDDTAGLMTAAHYSLLYELDQAIDTLGGKGLLLGEINTNPQASAVELSFTTLQKSSTGTIENGTVKEQIAAATSSVAGVMSAADKAKLDGIAPNANAYVLPTATASTLGGVKSSTTGTTPGKDYLVQVNSDGTMKVNVPWVDTKYTLPAASASVLGGIKVGAGLAITGEGVLSATGGGEADSVAWANVSGKPSEFNPSLASTTVRGGVKVGSGLTMSGEALGVDLTAQSPVVQKWQNDIENANTIVETSIGRKYLKLAGGTMTGNLTMTSAEPVFTMTATDSVNTIVLNPSDGDTQTAKIALSSSDGNTEINLSTSEGSAKLTSNRLSFGDTLEDVKSMLSDRSLQIGVPEGNNIEVTSTDITKNGQSVIPVALSTGEIEAICV